METTARGGELDGSVGNSSNDYKNSVGDLSFYRRGIGFILLLSALTLSACGTPLDLLPRGLQPAMYRDYEEERKARDTVVEETQRREYKMGDYLIVTNLANGETQEVWGEYSAMEYSRNLRTKNLDKFPKGYIIQNITDGKEGLVIKWKPDYN